MALADAVSLGRLGLHAGEARRLELEVALSPLLLAGERYEPMPPRVPARLDVSRTVSGGFTLRLRFASSLGGRCVRCLEPASPLVEVDAREVELPGGGEEESSPYVEGELLALREWAHDAFVLAAPAQILCEPACEGLCPVCAVRLATAEAGHHHEVAADPRWAALRNIRLQ